MPRQEAKIKNFTGATRARHLPGGPLFLDGGGRVLKNWKFVKKIFEDEKKLHFFNMNVVLVKYIWRF